MPKSSCSQACSYCFTPQTSPNVTTICTSQSSEVTVSSKARFDIHLNFHLYLNLNISGGLKCTGSMTGPGQTSQNKLLDFKPANFAVLF